MRRRLLIGLLVAGALVVGVGAAPAAAHPANPWTGAHTLCWNARQCVTQGNLVMLWQSVLFVGGSFVSDSTLEIDSSFGSRTHEATRAWQSNHGIRSDGRFYDTSHRPVG